MSKKASELHLRICHKINNETLLPTPHRVFYSFEPTSNIKMFEDLIQAHINNLPILEKALKDYRRKCEKYGLVKEKTNARKKANS